MPKNVLINRDSLSALLAAAGGCLAVMYASPIIPLMGLLKISEGQPVAVQLGAHFFPVGCALMGYFAGAFLGASIPWVSTKELRAEFPIFVAAAATAGAVGGFFLSAKISAPSLQPLLHVSVFLPLFMIGGVAARVAAFIHLPRPGGALAWIVTLVLSVLVLGGFRYSAATPWPLRSTPAERTDWSRGHLGSAYETALNKLQASPVLRSLYGPSCLLTATPTLGHLTYLASVRVLWVTFDVTGAGQTGLIDAWISKPYRSAEHPTFKISVKTAATTLYLTPDGELDPAHPVVQPHQGTDPAIATQIVTLFIAKKYAQVISIYESNTLHPVTASDPLMQTDVKLAVAKSYEFLKKKKQAAGLYVLLALEDLEGLNPDVVGGLHFAKVALALDPKNAQAKAIVQANQKPVSRASSKHAKRAQTARR